VTDDVLEYLQAMQIVKASAPALGLNLPGTQAVQFWFIPDQPATHTHLESEPLLRVEFVFARHK